MVKTLTITERVYNILIAMKKEDESFSMLLERLSKKTNSADVLKSISGCMKIKDKEQIISEIYEKRSEWR